ncbi:MAG: hypothetical protein E6R03_08330 [Hyphomicrobiaceae bacterium]|nr:MAG: hypothetical protein E6R03_08330 [Hyphomicrobiaceae bacterium]
MNLTRLTKGVLTLAIVSALAVPASAQSVFSAKGTVSDVNSAITFSPRGPSLVRVFNDGTSVIFAKFNAVPTAVAGSTFLIGACEVRTFYVGGGDSVNLIADTGLTSAYRVEAEYRTVVPANANVGPLSLAVSAPVAIPGCSTVATLPASGAAVASATAMPAPTGRVFHVTGTTNITSVLTTGIVAGTVVTLIFDGILTFTDGNNLKLAGNLVTTADDTITLGFDGTNFFEIARSVN